MPGKRRSARQSHLALAQNVLAYIQERGMRRGDHLPEQLFSEHCGVSRTPIRSAFKILFENDILTWREEEGYFLNVDDASVLSQTLHRLGEGEQSLAQRILADRSQRRIDDVQSVSSLARRYNVSRHSVLNSLKILSQDGIVNQLPGRSWAFHPLLDTQGAVEQSLRFRMALEPQAILEPGFNFDRKKGGVIRRRMQELLQRGDGEINANVFLNLDTDFHSFVGECSANRFLRSALTTHQRLRHATQRNFSIPEFRLRQSLEEHIEILDSLQTGQLELAADLMLIHLRRSHSVRPDALNRGGPPMMHGGRA